MVGTQHSSSVNMRRPQPRGFKRGSRKSHKYRPEGLAQSALRDVLDVSWAILERVCRIERVLVAGKIGVCKPRGGVYMAPTHEHASISLQQKSAVRPNHPL